MLWTQQKQENQQKASCINWQKASCTVVNREFLCDCQLDLEHASILRQLSSCSKSKSTNNHMKFTVNLGFWEIFKTRSPNSASNIQPHYTDEVQIFSVDLYEPQVKKLDQPVDLESFMETMGTDGLRIPTFEWNCYYQEFQDLQNFIILPDLHTW